MKRVVVAAVIYGLSTYPLSLLIYQMFGTTGQLVFIPITMLGGLFVGFFVMRRALR